ncbi:hypothetical protein LCGC14_1677640 [marine sediment metagenome]|uniref:Uncharacterized protein n=1 Tax=marine sediment metagenome TaxID=412755 RepID=A0A0F9HPM1_9ZZZZ
MFCSHHSYASYNSSFGIYGAILSMKNPLKLDRNEQMRLFYDIFPDLEDDYEAWQDFQHLVYNIIKRWGVLDKILKTDEEIIYCPYCGKESLNKEKFRIHQLKECEKLIL